MCGIIGYTGYRDAVEVLVKGLEQLEYRGYDSAGIACLGAEGRAPKDATFLCVKEKGKLAALKSKLQGYRFQSHLGIGHTRWATHGEPSRENAHPHTDFRNTLFLVHNGIIENYAILKSRLQKKKIKFTSQTDTEVASVLLGEYLRKKKPIEAFQKTVSEMEGFFAMVSFLKEDPSTLYAFKRSNPLVIGLGSGENFVASDVTAVLAYTRKMIYLDDGELAVIRPDSVEVYKITSGKKVTKKPTTVSWDVAQAKKQGYPHFMLKEMHEQPRVLDEILGKCALKKGHIQFETLTEKTAQRLKRVGGVSVVSCGTAYHAGIVGALLIEKFSRIPVKIQTSSEFRYSDPIIGKKDLVILITQSGETADTLAALREAKARGSFALAIVNVVGSTVAREADAVLYTHAGPEIGVASTKAYVAQLLTLLLFAVYFGRLKGNISSKRLNSLIREIKKLPKLAAKTLKLEKQIELCAKKHYLRRNFLYLGRRYNFPTALEGALKLKEISYAHAHGYAAGEMKHGPIALIDDEQVVICIAPQSATFEKMLSNIEEIKARSGIVVSIGTEKSSALEKLSDSFFGIPKTPEELSPILTVIPLQLFAYYISVFNGRDVDQPRNLAKSVTVE